MFALWLILTMGGAECTAIAVCDEEGSPSCEAVVLSCDAPVSLDACLDTAGARGPGDAPDLEPMHGLGCSTALTLEGFPATVDFDRDEMERAQ